MENLKVINYYPELRAYAGSINAVIIISYLEECFKRQGRFFYKFMEPCAHMSYKRGESWSEVLQMTTTEFRTAFKNIGVVYKSKKAYDLSPDKFQGKMYLSYYDRMSKLTYYMRNDDLVNRKFEEVKMQREQHSFEYEGAADNKCKKHNRSKCAKEDGELINDEICVGIIYDKTNSDTKTNIDTKTNTNYKTDMDNQAKLNYGFDMDHQTNTSHGADIDNQTNASYMTDISECHELMTDQKVDREDVTYLQQNSINLLPFEEIKGLFNQICQSYDGVTKWSAWQKQKLERLWKIYDKNVAIFRVAFEMVEASDFLSGRIKNWKAQMDWILKPNHFADILEGKYKNFKKAKHSSCRFGEGMYSREWDFDEIERLEQRRIDKILENRGFVGALG